MEDDRVIGGFVNTQFFVDTQGRFIGAFGDGATPPEGAVEVDVPPPDGRMVWAGEGWTYDPATFQAICAAAIDAHVEATAQAKGYNGAAHLASYVASTVPAWAAEAQAFVAWRDAVWLAAYAMQETAVPPPAVADVIAGLPVIEWPE
ncbi:hypothetical protein [Paragemmobacter ruber]|uniref:Tail fiber assembly protein n=1 Tax=Paragemmobacter ruber TaxID=1985673 RepID=A0ABW9Y1A7_9RHOB|nr:hypothetical protein [Rhodobacter ruber]NBE05921.1 hypothetical protein [Rhodobacter ruber]